MKKILLGTISFAAYEWLPYPVACLISHCNKDDYINEHYTFMEPEYRSDFIDQPDFIDRLTDADILGLTNWVWNQNYNDRIAARYKDIRPDGIVIYGGVNVPSAPMVAKKYAVARPYVDIFFVGPAEETFRRFLIDYQTKNFSGHAGTFTHTENNILNKKHDFKDTPIPSPYTDGIFDNIIENAKKPLSALFETNRGCPYACAFCDWGGMTKSKIVRKDKQEVMDTISYIMGHEGLNRIEIGDANFGIFPEDVEYTKHMIAEKNKRVNDINLTMGGFAKNGSNYMEEIMQLMHNNFDAYHGRKYIKVSFQSHDPVVLESSQRSNIDNTKLFPMMKRFQEQGIEVDAEMIMGMPGDNQERWLETIQKNMDLNINHQKSFSLWIVPNTPMASDEYKEKYKVKTKRVLVPYDLDNIKTKAYHANRLDGNHITTSCDFSNTNDFQSLEFIYECFSFDSEELMRIYDVWFWFNTLYNGKIARKWMLDSDLSAKEQYAMFINAIENGNMPFFSKLLTEFRYAVWNTIASPEEETRLTELYLVNFLTKFSMRGNEMVDLYLNQDQALKELRLIYPDINFNHFININNDEIIRLYFVSAEII